MKRGGKGQINTFSGGINLDVDKSLLKPNQYRYAENIRTITNEGATTGALTNIESSRMVKFGLDTFASNETIIGTTTVRDLGIVFTKMGSGSSFVNNIYRVITTNEELPILQNVIPQGIDFGIPDNSVLSIVGRYEDLDNIKVYWADGTNYIRVINIAATDIQDAANAAITSATMFDIIPSANLKRPSVASIGSGRLNAGLIQYCYQLYSPSGAETELSPMSPMIHLTSSTSDATSITYLGTGLGNIYGKPTGKSVKIRIDLPTDNQFTRVKLISVYYFNSSEVPVITIVKESVIADQLSGGSIYLEDGGVGAIGELTQDEFNLIGANLFKPNYIESKDNILFAANTKEDTWDGPLDTYDTRSYQFSSNGTIRIWTSSGIEDYYVYNNMNTIPLTHDCIHKEIYEVDRYADLEYVYNKDGKLGGSGVNVDYVFTNTYFIESYGDYWNQQTTADQIANPNTGGWATPKSRYIDQRTPRIGDKKRNISSLTLSSSDGSTGAISIQALNIPIHDGFLNYANPYLSNNIGSYQRDEIYRFGMIGYDEKGRKSPVSWIADIRFPAGYIESVDWNSSIFETPAETTNKSLQNTFLNLQELLVKPLGILFKFNNIPTKIKKIEIVRSKRDINNKTIYAQGTVQKTGTYKTEYKENGAGELSEIITGPIPESLSPHSIMSMGYSYSIAGPVRTSPKPTVGITPESNWYSWREFDDNIHYPNDAKDRFNTAYTDHSLSPYFYNRASLLFINPETSYYGVDFVEQLRNISDSLELDIVDVIYPISTPILNLMDASSKGSVYYGNPDLTGFQFATNPGGVIYPSAMYFGADINPKGYVKDFSASVTGVLSTQGMVGMKYTRIFDSVGDLPRVRNNSGGPICDINNLVINNDYYELADRAFISLGGIITARNPIYYHKNSYSQAITSFENDWPLITIDGAMDEARLGFTFKYFNRYSTESSLGNHIDLIYQLSGDIRNYSNLTLFSLNTSSPAAGQDIFSTGDQINLIKKINSFEYSGNITPGSPIGGLSAASYINSGSSQYLNWTSPLTSGNEGGPYSSDHYTIINPLSKSKACGPHGDGIVLNFKNEEQLPSIVKINQERKKYSQGLYTGYKTLDAVGSAALSTFVVNMKVMNAYIYGGSGLLDRQFTEYISTGTVFDNPDNGTASNAVVFGGDTFIGIFDYSIVRATDPYVGKINDGEGGRANLVANQVKYIGALIPLESSINMHLVNSKSYVADNYNFAIQKEPGVYSPGASGGSSWKYSQEMPQYAYNAAYSAENTSIGFLSKLLITKSNKTFDCRIWSSEIKTNDEIYDSWSKWKIANYIDVDTQFGEITGLQKFKDKLLFWQKNAFGVVATNERALIKDNNISMLTLGTAGILSRFDYITTANGRRKGMIGGIAESESSLYWFDADNAEMCTFDNQLTPLSKVKGIQTLLNKNKKNITNFIPMIYDKKYNEVLLTLYGLQGTNTIA